jgi:DNA polymerase
MLDRRRAMLWDAMQIGPRWSVRNRDLLARAAVATGDLAKDVNVRAAGVTMSQGEPPTPVESLDWVALESAVAGCTACGLCKSRKQAVFGVGNRQAHWLLVGEAPGAEEDARGEPFVGQAGRLLDNMLASVGLSRSGADEHAVYIANVLKCRPPGNRNPDPSEVARCEPYLLRQVALIQPRLILVMGRFAAQSLLGTDAAIAALRGRVHAIRIGDRDVPVVVTYHPAYLLRNLADKAKSWADLCLAREVYSRSAQ